jgi:hypothetical protein
MIKNGAERRQHERYQLKDRVFIAVRPEYDRIGWLTDISKGGVSYEYPAIHHYEASSKNMHVDIFNARRKIDLSNMPCQVIYDTRIKKDDGYTETIATHRCGLFFRDISQNQMVKLDMVLNQSHVIKSMTTAAQLQVSLQAMILLKLL